MIFFAGLDLAQSFWARPALPDLVNNGGSLHWSFCRTMEVTEPKKKRKEEKNRGE
jgi:hypothetical protein